MNCPPEIADLLLTVIRTGLLRIRAASWRGDATRAGIEADHIHNLPELVRNYSTEVLRYYWDVERAEFLKHVGASGATEFDPIWDQLRAHVGSTPLAESA